MTSWSMAISFFDLTKACDNLWSISMRVRANAVNKIFWVFIFIFRFLRFRPAFLIYVRANHKLLARRNNGIEFFYNSLMRLYITHSYWIWLSFIRRLFEWFLYHFFLLFIFLSLVFFSFSFASLVYFKRLIFILIAPL